MPGHVIRRTTAVRSGANLCAHTILYGSTFSLAGSHTRPTNEVDPTTRFMHLLQLMHRWAEMAIWKKFNGVRRYLRWGPCEISTGPVVANTCTTMLHRNIPRISLPTDERYTNLRHTPNKLESVELLARKS